MLRIRAFFLGMLTLATSIAAEGGSKKSSMSRTDGANHQLTVSCAIFYVKYGVNHRILGHSSLPPPPANQFAL